MTIEKNQFNQQDLLVFRISRIFGAFYEIYNPELGYKNSVLRGKLRLEKGDERNLFTVGDYVSVEKKNESDYTILYRLERKNYLVRKGEQGGNHVLCANVDYVGIIASLRDPETKNGFIDRSIAACYHANITPLLIYTKKDLVSEEEIQDKVSIYGNLGYKIFLVSQNDTDSILNLRESLLVSTTYFVGISGSGKSTLINSMIGHNLQKVSSISTSTNKGKHTTTNSYLLSISNSGYLIDSPGIKEWGIFHIPKDIVLESFPELLKIKDKCEKPNCCDFNYDCPMLEELNTENLEIGRQESAIGMLESLDRLHKIRTGNLKSGKFRNINRKK